MIRRLNAGGLDKFYDVQVLGDTLILATGSDGNSGYIAVDFEGHKDKRYGELLAKTKRVFSHRGGTGYGGGEFVVFETYVAGRASTFDLVLVEAPR